MRLTFLTPTENWARTAKAYSQPDRSALAHDYQLGTFFTFEEVVVKSLEELRDAMLARPRAIAIYGTPTDKAKLLGEVKRRTENFPYPEDQTLHLFDIDKWPIPQAVRDLIKPDLTDPHSMGELVNAMLRNEGFDILADADKLIVLTSSSWDTTMLNCHIRVDFDQAVRVEALREFSLALGKVSGRKIFDDAVYKSVQPQFFNPPTCLNFKDPYEGKRIFVHPGATRKVSLSAFTDLVNKTIKQAGWNPEKATNELPPIGHDWLQTIQMYVGNERGINEPAYRAASQLVQSVGRKQVLASIHDYAQQMFDAVWSTLATKGERGDSKDKKTYTVACFRQYLESATTKNFGDKVDQLVQRVNEAIYAGQEGSLDKLMSTPVIHALNELKANHVQSFIPLKTAILNTHKLLKAQDFNALLKAVPDTPPGGDLISGGGDEWNENKLIDPILQQYDYIADYHGNRYASVPGNGDGGYRMMRIDGSLINVFYADGLRMSGNQVTSHFGKKALSKLLGVEDRASESGFEKVLIGTRVVAEDQTTSSPTWLNLGKQPDGQYKTAKITADGVTLVSHQDSKPRWFHGIPALTIPTSKELNDKFNGFDSMMDYLQSELQAFVCTDDDDLIKAIMWVCSTMADKSLAYLLEILGAPGTGKSTAADFMKDLVDPSGKGLGTGADRTAFLGVTSDFINDVERRYVTVLDNISKLQAKEQDMLCMISTGLRHSERILYTQSMMERVVRRPLIVTALNTIITRSDLRSRVVTIETRKTPFAPRYLEQWYEKRGYFTACLLQLTSKTLKLYREVKTKPDGIHPRDIFLACVHSAMRDLNEVDFFYVEQFRLREAYEAAYDSGFISVLIRFLDEKAVSNTVTINTRHLHEQLRKWCSLNAGKEIDGVTIDMMSVPETARGMGWEMAKNIDVVEKVSGWRVHQVEKLSNGKRYTFKKTVDLLSRLL